MKTFEEGDPVTEAGSSVSASVSTTATLSSASNACRSPQNEMLIPADSSQVGATMSKKASVSPTSPLSPRSRRPTTPPLQERLAAAMQAVERGLEPPGASDKWRVLQLFHETIPKSQAKVLKIERIAQPSTFSTFVHRTGCGNAAEDSRIVFFAPRSEEQLHRLRTNSCFSPSIHAEDLKDFENGIPIASSACVALKQRIGKDAAPETRSLCILLYAEGTSPQGSPLSSSSRGCRSNAFESYVTDISTLLLVHIVHFSGLSSVQPERRLIDGTRKEETEQPQDLSEQSRTDRQLKYAKVRDSLVKAALQSLERPSNTKTSTVLPSGSEEAEAVVSLYLLGGGAAKMPRLPGVNLREALGGVIVQRIENRPLFQQYMSIGQEFPSKALRFQEDVVWHGTRLKRPDEAASLAEKLQSIAENGFDPSRCIKGATAGGGIWVATGPMESFGLGCDGLVAFVLCLAKTHFNEWVDTSCARVLQRERVLPLYSLVHA